MRDTRLDVKMEFVGYEETMEDAVEFARQLGAKLENSTEAVMVGGFLRPDVKFTIWRAELAPQEWGEERGVERWED